MTAYNFIESRWGLAVLISASSLVTWFITWRATAGVEERRARRHAPAEMKAELAELKAENKQLRKEKSDLEAKYQHASIQLKTIFEIKDM